MRRANDTGEPAAAMNARADDLAWQTVLPLLKAGATLLRVPKLRRSYADCGQGPAKGGLTDGRMRRLERDGVIRQIGVDRYALVEVAA